jgi:hypothetical protein
VKTLFAFLILLLSLQPVFAQHETTIEEEEASPETDTAFYVDHQLIAILPFRTTSPEIKYKKGAPKEQVISEETIFSKQVQQAFYNSIMDDEMRWRVSVQDYHVTDSILEKNGISLQKVGFMDKQMLAALLKVDAVLMGQLENFSVPGVAISMSGRISTLIMSLYDGKTGDHIWTFRDSVRVKKLIDKSDHLDPDLYSTIRRRCPYTSKKTYQLSRYR